MNQETWPSRVIGVAVASALGILIAVQDKAAPFGDDSAPFTVLLWLVSSGLLGFVLPRRPWLWALSIGPWLPLMYLVLQGLGVHAPIKPDTFSTSLILIPIALGVCAVGAYAGALARRMILPPSRAAEPLAGAGR
ncbi:MAG TPA: hypothetical protein VFF52_25875 [Isosphaeraceae bacterium]|nr:hypothetical protein [Isosphaeraceae bacterium]